MRLVIFGLTVSSSWGNGHAALWRGLIRALHEDGHHVTFFERDVPYYAAHRDLHELPRGELVFYREWDDRRARLAVQEADVAMVTSYCADAPAATAAVLEGKALRCFYDLDTPVTLARIAGGEAVPYIGDSGLSDFDLVFSYAGGPALNALRSRLNARRVLALPGSVDPDTHRPGTSAEPYRSSLSYLGTFAADRQAALMALMVAPARARPELRFTIAGAQYPADFPWSPNIFFKRHLPASEHPAFYASSRLTLNVTRAAMAQMGWCPSGRLFEAAACGAAIATDEWPGLADFFEPGEEILVTRNTADMLAALDLPDATLRTIARRARERTLAQHTARHRAREMVAAFEAALYETAVT